MKVNAAYGEQAAKDENISIWREYFALTKPTITLLVVVTLVPSLLLASNGLPGIVVTLMAIFGTALTSASAAVFNQSLESHIDNRMMRTQSRSIPRGRINPFNAISFGVILGFLGLCLLYFGTNSLAVLYAIAGHAFYILVYTLFLKKRTAQNIVIGGAAGAVGPLIGWAAVAGQVEWPAWAMFMIIFLWTPPHFWALALKYTPDYAAAGIPMYPVVYGDHKTRRAIFYYSLTLLLPVLALYIFGAAGVLYLSISLPLTIYFAKEAYSLYASGVNDNAMKFFHFSCLYTFIIFGSLTFDSLINLI